MTWANGIVCWSEQKKNVLFVLILMFMKIVSFMVMWIEMKKIL